MSVEATADHVLNTYNSSNPLSAFAALGLPQSCTLEEAKASYKKLALLFHPDKSTCSRAVQVFQVVSSALSAVRKQLEDNPGTHHGFQTVGSPILPAINQRTCTQLNANRPLP